MRASLPGSYPYALNEGLKWRVQTSERRLSCDKVIKPPVRRIRAR